MFALDSSSKELQLLLNYIIEDVMSGQKATPLCEN